MARADRRPPTPDTVAPSLEGADERAVLTAYLTHRARFGRAACDYRTFREAHELACSWDLPAKRPRGLRRLHRRTWLG